MDIRIRGIMYSSIQSMLRTAVAFISDEICPMKTRRAELDQHGQVSSKLCISGAAESSLGREASF